MYKIVPGIHITQPNYTERSKYIDKATEELVRLTGGSHRALNPQISFRDTGNGVTGIWVYSATDIHINTPSPSEVPPLILEKLYEDDQLQRLRASVESEFDAKLKEIEARHSKQLSDLRQALRDASQAALREASLTLLKEVVITGVIEGLPERLAAIIDQKVRDALNGVAPE